MGPKRRWWRWALLGVVLLLIGSGVMLVLGWQHYETEAEQFDLSQARIMPERSTVYDREGKVIAYIHGENRFLLKAEAIPANFVHALLAREDSRFWTHDGIDPTGIARAFHVNLKEGGIRQGGSTLTQQLVRNTFNLRERTVDRKLTEAFLARRFERVFSKEEILIQYINRIYYGHGAYGLERAAHIYFNKPAKNLTLAQSALLVALIRSPNRHSPFTYPKQALAERNQVLNRLITVGTVPYEQVRAARREPLRLDPGKPLPNPQNEVMEAVRREVARLVPPAVIRQGGLKIQITIDSDLQKLAHQAVQEQTHLIEKQRRWPHPRMPKNPGERTTTPWLQGALIAIENQTGAIRAFSGGRDFSANRFDRALLARRQVGSTFKPFLYAAAFDRGLFPGSLVNDAPITPGEYPRFPKRWNPSNADGKNIGLQPVSTGLVRSRNTMSIRVGMFTGLEKTLEMAGQLGLGELPPYPAIFLGGFETTLREMTGAYTVFPNLGQRPDIHLISRIDGPDWKPLYRPNPRPVHVFNPASAWMTSQLLQEVLKTGTGSRANRMGLRHPAAGKTGTTNQYKDAWFVGYTSTLTCGVWIGFDHPKTIIKGGFGSTLAMPLWIRFIQSVPQDRYPANPLIGPSNLQYAMLCSASDRLAHEGCQLAASAYPVEIQPGLMPTENCELHAVPESMPPPIVAEEPDINPPPDLQRTSPPPVATPGLRRQPPREQLQRTTHRPRAPRRRSITPQERIEDGVIIRKARPVGQPRYQRIHRQE